VLITQIRLPAIRRKDSFIKFHKRDDVALTEAAKVTKNGSETEASESLFIPPALFEFLYPSLLTLLLIGGQAFVGNRQSFYTVSLFIMGSVLR
jgi:hypothetical protein